MDRSFLHPTGRPLADGTSYQQFHPALSNASANRQAMEFAGITDFSVFNPYVHYVPKEKEAGGVEPLATLDFDRQAVTLDYRLKFTLGLTDEENTEEEQSGNG